MTIDPSKFDLSRIGNANSFIALALDAIALIGRLVGGATADKAADILTVVRVIVDAVRNAHDGKVTVEQAHAEIKKLAADIQTNDARADAALAARFGSDKP